MTEWQPIEGYEEKYEVSSDGRVRRYHGSEIGQWVNDRGYRLVRLSSPRKMFRVHRLVAQAFVPNPDRAPQVNHLDHDRGNNKAANLEWCSQQQNLAHATAAGRMRRNYWRGRRSPNALFSSRDVQQIRFAYAIGEGSLAHLGRVFGASKRTIGRIVNREYYQNV